MLRIDNFCTLCSVVVSRFSHFSRTALFRGDESVERKGAVGNSFSPRQHSNVSNVVNGVSNNRLHATPAHSGDSVKVNGSES